MVYWGCHTARNRCVWIACAGFAATAVVLLCVGSGRMWVCNHTAADELGQEGDPWSCRVKAGILMALSPVVVLLGVLPTLLFFQSCFAVRPPQPIDIEKGTIPSSGITVIRRTSNGAAVYRYDSQGRLLQAPDCYRHTNRTPPPHQSRRSPGAPATAAHWEGTLQPGRDVHLEIVQQQQQQSGSSAGGDGKGGSAANKGKASSNGSSGVGEQARLYGSSAGAEEAATAEVFISWSPRRHQGPPTDGDEK